MTPDQRDAAEEALLASESLEEIEERDAMAEGDSHLDAKMEARDTLRAYYAKRGRRIYIGADIKVFYPGEKGFTPDVIAVTDVEPGPRDCWMVSREGKGVDLAIEVHYKGRRRKDFVENVTRYASFGIAEYFVYDLRRERLMGYRLPRAGARTYEAIRSRIGRYRSEVLELDLTVERGRLRFYADTAELIAAKDLVGKLESMVEEAVDRAEHEQDRAEQALARLSAAILMVLKARCIAFDDAVEQRIIGSTELAELDRWLVRAGSVAAAEELFAES